MRTTDGFKLASSAAALLVAGAAFAANADGTGEGPVKISQCAGVAAEGQGFGADNLVSFSSGHAMVSKSFCDKLGGSEVATVSEPPATPAAAGIEVAYCNDLFSCNTFSACKGNGNDSCAGINTCHGIGFVGIASADISLSEQLCSKLGGNLISEL